MKTVFVLDGSSPNRAGERGTCGGRPMTGFEAEGIAAHRDPGFEAEFRFSSLEAGDTPVEVCFQHHHARKAFHRRVSVAPAMRGQTGGFGHRALFTCASSASIHSGITRTKGDIHG